MRRFVLAALAAAGPAAADLPPAAYFTGVYLRIGRDVAGVAVNDAVRLDPAEGGLALRVCGAGAGQPPEILLFEPLGEIPNLVGNDRLWCLHSNNGDNYPILNCAGEGQARLTLWPEPDQPCPP